MNVSAKKGSMVAFVCSLLLVFSTSTFANGNWRHYNNDQKNTRNAKGETTINRDNIDKLIIKWEVETVAPNLPDLVPLDPNDATLPIESRPTRSAESNPIIVGNVLYYSNSGGILTARNKDTGALIWQKDAYVDYSTPDKMVLSFAAAPVVKGKYIVIGGEIRVFNHAICPDEYLGSCVPHNGAVVLAINRHTGDLIWSKKVDDHIASKVRGSVSIFENKVFVPLTSIEEEMARIGSAQLQGGDANDAYPCCSFRGSVVALDLKTGNQLWKSHMSPGDNVPDGILEEGETGFTGVAIWQHSPVIDKKRRQIYVGTHNNYTVPNKAKQCERNRLDPTNNEEPELPAGITCANLSDTVGNYTNSVVALDMDTGAIKWAVRAREYDPWVHNCAEPDFYVAFLAPGAVLNASNNAGTCQAFPGPDYGFSMPMLAKVRMPDGTKQEFVVAGQKDGRLFKINPNTGNVVSITKSGPAGILGGYQAAQAFDGQYHYGMLHNTSNVNRPYDPLNFPVIPNFYYLDPLHQISGEFNLASGLHTANSLIGAAFPISGAGFDGNVADGRWSLVNPPQQAIDEADGISTSYEGGQLLTTTAFLTAVDLRSGDIKWQRPIRTRGNSPLPYNVDCGNVLNSDKCGTFLPFNIANLDSGDKGPGFTFSSAVTHANGLIFTTVFDGETTFVALDARNGEILYEFKPLNSDGLPTSAGLSRMAIVNGRIYLGTSEFDKLLSEGATGGGLDRNNRFYALCLDTNDDGICDDESINDDDSASHSDDVSSD